MIIMTNFVFVKKLKNYAYIWIDISAQIIYNKYVHEHMPVRQRKGLRRCMELRNDSAGQRDDCADHNPVLQDGFW